MRIAAMLLYASLHLATAWPADSLALFSRAPPPFQDKPNLAMVADQIKKGLSNVYGGAGLRPPNMSPKGGGMPLRNMFGGLPELNSSPRPARKNEATPGTPGTPLGPRKKPGRTYPSGSGCGL